MKKYIIFLFLIFVACQSDEIVEPEIISSKEMIFEMNEVLVKDNQNISFEILTNTPHQLIISKQNGSTITKETFIPTIGINTRKIYTKSLPKENLTLKLENENEILESVSIIIR